MPLPRRRVVALAAGWLVALSGAPGAVAADEAIVTPPDATRVVAPCNGGPGRLSVTVLPRGDGSYHISVLARRLRDVDSQWRADVLAEPADGDELTTTFRRRPVDRSWSFAWDVTVEGGGPALLIVAARRLREDGTPADRCLVASSPDRPEAAVTSCGRRLEVLVVRPQDDGTTSVRHTLFTGAPHRRWVTGLEVESPDAGQGSAATDRSNRRGVVRTRFDLEGDLDRSVFTATAESESGRRCWLRLDPGSFTSHARAEPLRLPGDLLRRVTRG